MLRTIRDAIFESTVLTIEAAMACVLSLLSISTMLSLSPTRAALLAFSRPMDVGEKFMVATILFGSMVYWGIFMLLASGLLRWLLRQIPGSTIKSVL